MLLLRWFFLLLSQAMVDAYWLMAASEFLYDRSNADVSEVGMNVPDNILTTQRIDPIVNPGLVSTHVHAGNTGR